MDYSTGSIGCIGTIQPGDQDAPTSLPPYLRLSRVAQLLGVGRSTLYRWKDEGRIPFVHRPGGFYVPTKALIAFLDAEAAAALENLRPDEWSDRADG